MSLEDLISDSGGLIGVWAGMSFLTIFQAISYLMRYFEERRKSKQNAIASRDFDGNIRKPIHSFDLDFATPTVQPTIGVSKPAGIIN